MSEANIWNKLRSYGISEAGAAGIMGNLYAESLLCSNNVENRCALSDEVYTQQVDNGAISAYRFAHDAYGYGLAQWTYYTRKEALYKLAKSRGVSIADEAMQIDFLVSELKSDYKDLFAFLCTAGNILTATSEFCTKYERPAVNNIEVRYGFAVEFANKFSGRTVEEVKEEPKAKYTKITTLMPCLKKGSKGVAVMMIQIALKTKKYLTGSVDGDFGSGTDEALKAFQEDNDLTADGICGGKTWEKLYE